nr:anoctamin-6-like [Salvelinus alpinus]
MNESGDNILEMDSLSETKLEGDTEIEMGMEVVYSQEFFPTFESIPEGASVPKVEKAEFNGKSDSLFFNDGVRRIDFVLVYEDEDMKEIDKNRTFQKRKQRREYFEASLMKMGMELEAARSVVDEKLLFVKVHMPWDVLCTYAEVLHIKLPIQPNDLSTTSSPFNFLSCITRHFYPSEDLIAKETEYFTAPFEKDRLEYFYVKDRDLFFTPSMRSRMAYYILSRAPYEVRGNIKKFGVTKLLDGGVYKAAYPLHDCRFNVRSKEDECPNERYLLYNEWAHPKSFYKMQPLDLIRKYYGEKIGIYFAWLGFYTAMLALAAIVGLGCFIYGYTTQETSTWSKEVCDPLIGGNIVMCPQCDKECTYWRLNSTCESSKKLCIFDNYGTLVFAVFMAIWVTVFLEFWKRYQAELEYEWDTVEFLEQEEQPRPEYEAKCNHDRINPVTRVKEKVPYTACGRCIRVSLGIGTVLFWIVLILASVVAIIVYRLAVFFSFSTRLQSDLKELEPFKEYVTAQMATSVTASIISFVVIMVLNILYERVAIWITDFELPRTRTDYENSLTLKMFLFQFVNYYSSCFYIAFAKGKVVGYPGQPVYLLGKYRNEECDPGGCLIELTTQLTVIMGGKAIWNNIQEVLLPWMKNLIFRYCTRVGSEKVIPRWEQDYQLQPIGKLGLFYEYLEMGKILIRWFCDSVCGLLPPAPVLALVNNLFEMGMLEDHTSPRWFQRRPRWAWHPFQGHDHCFHIRHIQRLVYYWSFSVYPYGDHSSHTMQGYINNTLSVFDIQDFSNKSRPLQTPYWFNNSTTCRYRDFRYPPGHHRQYEYSIYYWHVIAAKMAFIIVVEHIVYLTKFVLSYVIPDVPYTVREQIKREKYLSQVILHETNLKLVTKRLKPVADKILKHNEDKEEEMDLYF